MRSLRLSIICFCAAFALSACGGGGGSNNNGGGGSPPPPPALTITTPSILAATLQNHAYSTTLAATNGQGALHWSIAPVSSTALFVTGLTMDANTGTLSGTANFGGTAGFIATVKDSASTPQLATKSFTVTAYQPLTSAQSQAATVTEFQTFLNVHAGIQGGFPPVAYSVSSGTMPPGLKFDSTGQLVGSAYQTGTFQFTLAAQDSFSPPESASQPFTITVTSATLTLQNSLPSRIAVNRPFSGRLVALGGTPPYSFALANGNSLPFGLSLNPNTGVVSGTPTIAGDYPFGLIVTDSSSPMHTANQQFNIDVEAALGRNDSPATATPMDNGSIQASISPYIDPPNGAPTAGDNDYYKLVSLGGSVVHVETVAKRSNPNNPLDTVIEIVDANSARLTLCRQPGDTSTTFASSCINDDISASPHVQDSALDFQVPGQPNIANTFYVHVFDWRGDARPDMTYSLEVSGVVDPLTVQPQTLPPAERGVAYGATVFAANAKGAVSWSLLSGSLPPGLSLDTNENIIGTPTTTGTYKFTLQATDSSNPPQTATGQETLVVVDPFQINLPASPAALPSACLSQPYSFQIPTTGGAAPLSWFFFADSGINWPGFAFEPHSGSFSGVPTQAGSFSGSVQVLDAAHASDSRQITLTVSTCP